jgi:hypothetical protein
MDIFNMSEDEMRFAEEIQYSCHKAVEHIMKNGKASHQDATNVFLFSMIAKLQNECRILEDRIRDLEFQVDGLNH